MNIAILFGRKNSKSVKNKNVLNFFGKPAFRYPLEAALKSKFINKIYVSTDSNEIINYSKRKNCEIINRPQKLCTDRALLEDAIQHAVNYCLKENKKVENIVILLCNSICVSSKELDKGFQIMKKFKPDSVTTVSEFNMFSPIRAKKISGNFLNTYVPNKVMSKYTDLSCDRDKSVDTFFCTGSFTISTANILTNLKKNQFPFRWIGKKTRYIIQDNCVGDIDFEWQLPAIKWWLKKNIL